MSTEEWHADIEVTETLVTNCLLSQFPALAPIKTIQLIGEGWDNKVFLVNKQLIFRFPRRTVAVTLMEQENAVLTHLPSFPNIKIPVPQYIGKPSTDYPYLFQGYHLINGVSGHEAGLRDQERIESLPILATFLKQLHCIDKKQALALGAQPQIFNRAEMNKAISTLTERADKIIDRKIAQLNENCFQLEMTNTQNLILSPDDVCLIHGDLDCRHLLFDHKKLSGIIDWGDTGINHKAIDLAVIWSFYPRDCHPTFFQLYGEVDHNTWQYARFLGIYSALTLLLYGSAIEDALLVAESINAVKRINKALIT